MLDLHFLWDDSAPCIIACSGGLRYILLEASVMHHLPVVSRLAMHVLLEALHCFTETGHLSDLWNASTWSQKLGRKHALYRWSDPIRILPQEHSQFTDDPQVNFSSLQSSSSQPLPVTSSDVLPSSSVFTYNLGDRDPPTKDEEMTGEEGKIEGGISRQTSPRTSSKQICDKGAHRAQTEKERGSDSGKLSHNSLRQEEREVRGRIRKEDRRKGTENTVFANGASTVNNAFAPKVRFASHATSHIAELGSVQSSADILLHHKLPKARQRTNVVPQNYTPRGCLFGGYTTTSEGVTMALYQFPEVASAFRSIAATRPSDLAQEPYLSAQLNSAMSFPVHKHKKTTA